jgi:Holliday junction resolvase-like predicted endonuclease
VHKSAIEQLGISFVSDLLLQQHHKIVAFHYRVYSFEIDIMSTRAGQLFLHEVRTTSKELDEPPFPVMKVLHLQKAVTYFNASTCWYFHVVLSPLPHFDRYTTDELL